MSSHQGISRLSWVESAVTAIVIALLLVIGIPAWSALRTDHETIELLEIVKRAEDAVQEHHRDTGRFATEVGGLRRELSEGSGAGWRGPYWEATGPAESKRVEIYPRLDRGPLASRGSRFLVARDGAELIVQGDSQYLAIRGVAETVARELDRAFEPRPGGERWLRVGRVQWCEEQGGTLMVLLAQEP